MVATRLSLARKSLQQQASTSSPVCTLKSCLHDKRKTTKKMCAICKAPLPSPPKPQKVSSGDTPSNVSQNTEAPLPPPPMPLMVSSGDSPANVSSITEAPLPPPTLPPLGSTKGNPLEIPCDEEEEQRDIKLKLNPLSRLIRPPTKTNHRPYMHEKYKDIIPQVKSLLVDLLTSTPEITTDKMVKYANDSFKYLNGLGAEYATFYNDVKEFIAYKDNLLILERKENMLCFSELERRYEEVLLRDNDLDEDIADTKAELKKTEEKEEHLKRQIEELKQELANIEQKKESLKNDEYIYSAARKITQSEMEELGTRKDAAEVAQREIEQHKNEVLEGMVSVTRRLKSIC